MKSGKRHYSEEELLMHYLGEETATVAGEIDLHLPECLECKAIFMEYGDLVRRIQAWPVPELAEEVLQAQKHVVLARYREECVSGRREGMLASLRKSFGSAWNYALENPLPTLAYIAVALAFALERTITTFRLDRILPGANQVFELLRQVF